MQPLQMILHGRETMWISGVFQDHGRFSAKSFLNKSAVYEGALSSCKSYLSGNNSGHTRRTSFPRTPKFGDKPSDWWSYQVGQTFDALTICSQKINQHSLNFWYWCLHFFCGVWNWKFLLHALPLSLRVLLKKPRFYPQWWICSDIHHSPRFIAKVQSGFLLHYSQSLARFLKASLLSCRLQTHTYRWQHSPSATDRFIFRSVSGVVICQTS
jgi:hypothetical protein